MARDSAVSSQESVLVKLAAARKTAKLMEKPKFKPRTNKDKTDGASSGGSSHENSAKVIGSQPGNGKDQRLGSKTPSSSNSPSNGARGTWKG